MFPPGGRPGTGQIEHEPRTGAGAAQENGTLPRLKNEPGETWRAQNRCGYGIHVSRVFGEGLPRPGAFVVLWTRVLEKTSLLTALALRRVLAIIRAQWGLRGVQCLCLASDAGPHYWALDVLMACATDFLDTVRSSNGTPEHGTATVRQQFHLGQHGKNDEDAFLAELDFRISESEKQGDLLRVQDLCVVGREYAELKCGNQASEIHDDWIPEMRRHEWRERVPVANGATLPCGIRACHDWSLSVHDGRRVSLWDRERQCLSGVEVRAHLLHGMASKRELTTRGFARRRTRGGEAAVPEAESSSEQASQPECEGPRRPGRGENDDTAPLAPPPVPVAPENEVPKHVEWDGPVLASSTELPEEVRFYLGWRTSWRDVKNRPEKANRQRTRARLGRAWAHYEHLGLAPAQRQMADMQVRKELHAEVLVERSRRGKAIRAADKRRRIEGRAARAAARAASGGK